MSKTYLQVLQKRGRATVRQQVKNAYMFIRHVRLEPKKKILPFRQTLTLKTKHVLACFHIVPLLPPSSDCSWMNIRKDENVRWHRYAIKGISANHINTAQHKHMGLAKYKSGRHHSLFKCPMSTLMFVAQPQWTLAIRQRPQDNERYKSQTVIRTTDQRENETHTNISLHVFTQY